MCVHRGKSFQVTNGNFQRVGTKRSKDKSDLDTGLDFNINAEHKRRRLEGKMKVLSAHWP